MRFEKWNALGNDYAIFEAEALPWELTAERIRRICEPHFGVGSDGILLLSRTERPERVAKLRIFNPDGSEAELSGNGAREAVMYLRRSGWTDADEFTIETAAGPMTPTITSERTCTLDMGRASTTSKDYPEGPEDGRGELEAAGRRWAFQPRLGRQPAVRDQGGRRASRSSTCRRSGRRHRAATSCSRTGPTSASIRVEGSRVRARIFERGVGETLSSGPAPAARLLPRSWPARRAP